MPTEEEKKQAEESRKQALRDSLDAQAKAVREAQEAKAKGSVFRRPQ